MKVRGDFLEPPRSTDKTTLIIKVSNGAKIRNRYPSFILIDSPIHIDTISMGLPSLYLKGSQ